MKYILLFVFIGMASFVFGQAPDGFSDYFTTTGLGTVWSDPASWTANFFTDAPMSGGDGIPDGDDIVIITHDITVDVNSGYGDMTISHSSTTTNLTVTVNPGISLTGYNGTYGADFLFESTATGTKFARVLNSGGTINCSNLTIKQTNSGFAIFSNSNTSTITISGDLTLNAATITRAQFQALSGVGNVVNLAGSITGLGTINLGTNSTASTLNLNGSSLQVIPDFGNYSKYSNIQISNSVGVSPQGNLTNTNFYGSLDVSVGGLFSQNSNTIDIAAGSLTNAGTYTQNAALTVSGTITNSGTINQTAAITATGNITNSGTINTSTSIDANGNFTNSGTLASTGCNINIEGHWDNTGGTYTAATNDTVSFDNTGTTVSTISGTTNWEVLNINHATGVTVNSGAQNILGVLDIDQGTFTSGGLVTLVSSSSRTAQMDDIGSGAYSGDLTVERYIAKSDQSFTSLTSPVTGTTLDTWSSNAPIGSDSLIFSGFSGSDYPSFSFINTWFYDETIHGTAKDNGWVAASGMSDVVGASNNYKGVYIYMDAVNYKLYETGTPTTGNVTIPLDYTAGGGSAEDGWNLVGNPYPCTIDWELIYADAANTGNVIDGYLTYSGEYANYAWYDGATNTGSGGATKDIPSMQGIWLQSLNGTDLTINESMKNIADPGFLKSVAPPNMRIFLTGNMNSFQDEALIFSDASFDDAFEDGDITKFYTMSPDKAPTLFTKSTDGVDLAFNKVGVNSISIPLAATAGTLAQGTYTLDFAIDPNFMLGACFTLEDLHTGTITDLRTDTSYSYTTSDTTTLPRFIIHIAKDFNTGINALTCYGTNDGVVAITGNGITGSTFSLLDGAGNTINTGTASNDAITFNNVAGGTYEVSTNYSGSCTSNNTYSITVAEPMQVTADFNLMQDTLYLDQNDILEVTNNSLGTNFTWDFGDGNTSTFVNPTHTYVSPGVYPVMLTSNNDNIGQCSEVTTKNIVVMSGNPLSIEEVLTEDATKAYIRKGYIVVEFDLENKANVEISLIDINGKKIINTLEYISSGRVDLISTDLLANGVYIVNIISNNKVVSKKLIVE